MTRRKEFVLNCTLVLSIFLTFYLWIVFFDMVGRT